LDKGLLVLFLCPFIPGLGFSNMMWQLPCEAFAMAAFSQLDLDSPFSALKVPFHLTQRKYHALKFKG
jgi:hypothetical protein